MLLVILTRQLWSASCAMCAIRRPLDYDSALPLHACFLPFLMRTGLGILMTGGLRGDMQCSLVLIWLPGLLVSKLHCLGVVLKLSIKLWVMLQLNWSGYIVYCESCVFRKLNLLFFGVITSVLHICHLIQCSMPEQSTSKLTITLWGNVLHRSYFESGLSHQRISLLTSSRSHCPYLCFKAVGAILTC
jgi:hypothetical protein